MKIEDKEILETIKSKLPETVGEVLKQRLIKADQDAEKVSDLAEKNSVLQEKIDTLNRNIEEYQKLDDVYKNLQSKKEELDAREKKMEIEILEVKLAESEKRANISIDFVNGLVRNTAFRETIYDSENTNDNNQYRNTTKSYTNYKSAE